MSAAGHRGRPVDAELDKRDPAAVPRATIRQEILGAAGGVVLAGAWLIVSPYVLSYDGRDAAWNPILAGALILLLALARLTFAVWLSAISWINVALGTWLLGTSAWLAESSAARWNEAGVGGLIIVLALLSGGAADAARRRAAARD